MSNKNIHQEAKTPDLIQQELRQGFQWTTAHYQLMGGIVAGGLILGGIIAGYNALMEKKETALQEKYFSIEKNYVEKKNRFEEALKTQNTPVKKGDAKAEKAAAEALAKLPQATGDLQKDYGTAVSDFEAIVNESPNSKAAAMAALNAAELLANYKQQDQALEVLKKVSKSLKPNDLVSGLVLSAQANLMANKGDCKTALDLWSQINKSSSLTFMQNEMKLKMAICHESLNDLASAEKIYSEIASDPASKESPASQDAGKYLRAIKIKKNATN